jgi:hypothetical protein
MVPNVLVRRVGVACSVNGVGSAFYSRRVENNKQGVSSMLDKRIWPEASSGVLYVPSSSERWAHIPFREGQPCVPTARNLDLCLGLTLKAIAPLLTRMSSLPYSPVKHRGPLMCDVSSVQSGFLIMAADWTAESADVASQPFMASSDDSTL